MTDASKPATVRNNALAITLARNAIDVLSLFDAIGIDADGNILDPETARKAIDAALMHLTAARRVLTNSAS